ncbi:hypothetical protein WICMUC_004152 [Wickerhamomyces mucosus]|uniref:protein-serine/threonine phosphatase n=1 Tax=Wickerhamomyces mucosus TaxID=1378264 RepID=A0A9P8PIN4_9ASCO|nr:hypothetical protein WICMUC_004152 [Wickerhamomyces mucosus]
MGQLLSHPLNEKTVEYHPLNKFSHCIGSMQGYRLTQEDNHLVNFYHSIDFQNINNELERLDIKIFAIFDGHGGSETSEFLSIKLSGYILDEITKKESNLTLQKFKTNQGLIMYKLKNSFLNTDKQLYDYLMKRQPQSQPPSSTSNQYNSKNTSGSTAIVSVIINNQDLYSINTGDSRLIVSINGYVKNLSFDHKPNHIGELIRINDANGSISFNRVGGILALSRAFGDFNFKLKKYHNLQVLKQRRLSTSLNTNHDGVTDEYIKHLSSEETQVTVEPEIIIHKLSSNNEFIVLACDGIYDVFSNQEIVDYIRHHLSLGLRIDTIVTKLLEHAINQADQSTGIGFDNMSIILIANQLNDETLDQWYERIRDHIKEEKGLI